VANLLKLAPNYAWVAYLISGSPAVDQGKPGFFQDMSDFKRAQIPAVCSIVYGLILDVRLHLGLPWDFNFSRRPSTVGRNRTCLGPEWRYPFFESELVSWILSFGRLCMCDVPNIKDTSSCERLSRSYSVVSSQYDKDKK